MKEREITVRVYVSLWGEDADVPSLDMESLGQRGSLPGAWGERQ